MKTFKELLEMQQQLDTEVAKPRKDGFTPRKRGWIDIRGALDDELQEWYRELPDEFNFKTWKEKKYDREKELIEITDILFFFLQYANHYPKSCLKNDMEKVFEEFGRGIGGVWYEMINIKRNLWAGHDYKGIVEAFKHYISLITCRGFTKEEIINQYIKKWEVNIKIREDWQGGK